MDPFVLSLAEPNDLIQFSRSVLLNLWPTSQIQPMELCHPACGTPHGSRNLVLGELC